MAASKHGSLAEALAAAQAEMPMPKRNCYNPHHKYHYADLTACIQAIVPTLSKHGIAVVQEVVGDQGTVTVSTRLLFGPSEIMDCGSLTQGYQAGRNASQAMGSAITYARRFTLCSAVAVAPDEDLGEDGIGDDDAESLAGVRPESSPQRAPRAPRATKAQQLADQQLAKVKQILKEEAGCRNPDAADEVIRWVTGGCWSLDSMHTDPGGPGDVLAALQERNENGTPYTFMRDAADDAGRKEAKQ